MFTAALSIILVIRWVVNLLFIFIYKTVHMIFCDISEDCLVNFYNFLHTSSHRVAVEDKRQVICHRCGDKFESKHQLYNHMAGMKHHMFTPKTREVSDRVLVCSLSFLPQWSSYVLITLYLWSMSINWWNYSGKIGWNNLMSIYRIRGWC